MDITWTDFHLDENIFYFHNADLKSLTFVLDSDTKDNFYLNLLTKSLANVLDAPNDHSMVLAVPGKTNYFHPKIPAFDVKYIDNCIKINDFPDPTKYLIKNTSTANYTKDQIFDCWLHQNQSWSDLVSVSENQKNSGEDSDDIFSINLHLATTSLSGSSLKNTRIPYSHKEDVSIVKYIIKNKYAFNVNVVSMWQRMEHDNVCKYRSWQSMKQRYLKHIKNDLNSKKHSFPFLTPKKLQILQQGLRYGKKKNIDREAIKLRCNKTRNFYGSTTDSSS
ncbi:telomeric repeat-binding factor 2-interacting protein 1-like [Melanaphis sacchari]|uniref:Telomeric repeat-binding factor 2-interacting protein 1 n=1 Tax=Melanaphis sacchari TaxID=742174 RepID=A0A2H8TKL1_9HEMI|nr:telomeric repeat-binding factor 2-interacting protein 1-like [Melanaphis sacchari]